MKTQEDEFQSGSFKWTGCCTVYYWARFVTEGNSTVIFMLIEASRGRISEGFQVDTLQHGVHYWDIFET